MGPTVDNTFVSTKFIYQIADSLYGRDIVSGINSNVNPSAMITNTIFSQASFCDRIFVNTSASQIYLNNLLGGSRTCTILQTTNPNQVAINVSMAETSDYYPFMYLELSNNFM